MLIIKNRWRDKVKRRGVQLAQVSNVFSEGIISVMGWKALVA
jgi:hypothetical protein